VVFRHGGADVAERLQGVPFGRKPTSRHVPYSQQTDDREPAPAPRWVLRRADQACVAGLLLLAMTAMVGWWWSQGGASGRLIELNRPEPQVAEFQVDINQADWPELIQLPGIGQTLAKRIVESRTAEGPFLDHGELQRVHGIGPKTLEKVRPYLQPVPGGGDLAGR
jgi:competence protein ComEA